MAMTADENSESESDTKELPLEKITFNIDYKIKTSLKEPPSDLELKPLPNNLEYVFLEEPLFLPVIISSQLSEQNKNKLIAVLKGHKQAFAWKTTDFPRIFFGNSFDNCLKNLDKMIQRCKDANLILNWEKCHFMDKEGIMLGHKVSGACLEVEKAKIDVISKLPPPTNVKGIGSLWKLEEGVEGLNSLQWFGNEALLLPTPLPEYPTQDFTMSTSSLQVEKTVYTSLTLFSDTKLNVES
ncbi:hypothetical protein Tco_1444755 [Tanacetum coccineum]